MSILDRVIEVKNNLNEAKTRSNVGQTGKVKLLAVTKTQTIANMKEAIQAGITAVGENRVQEAKTKISLIPAEVEWHLIGHLQTNKVRQAVSMFDLIHSVDSERLVSEINRMAGLIQKRQDILIEVNVAGEQNKYGIRPAELFSFARFCSNLDNVRLCGIMTVAPFFEQPEKTRPIFREMYQLYMQLKTAKIPNTEIEWLSMGMSNDYIIAVEEGANLVRIGTGIFGARQY